MSEQEVERRWALVTGATGGLGTQMCHQLAARGWSLVLAGRNEARLISLAEKLAKTGVGVQTALADLSAPDGAQKLVSQLDERNIAPELLVNNAGLGYTAPFVESSLERQRALVQLNVMAPMELAHLLGARMAQRGRGAIIFVSSVAAVMPGPGMGTYFASKAFILSLSQALHEELARYGVRVMALCPGPVNTQFWVTAGSSAARVQELFTSPRRVAHAALSALQQGFAVCTPGVLSKVSYGFGRIVPNYVSRKVAGLLLGR